MFFLGIISWKDVSCFNGGEGAGVLFQMGGGAGWASFLSGGRPMGEASVLMKGGFERVLERVSKEFSKEFYILKRVSFDQHEKFQMMLS